MLVYEYIYHYVVPYWIRNTRGMIKNKNNGREMGQETKCHQKVGEINYRALTQLGTETATSHMPSAQGYIVHTTAVSKDRPKSVTPLSRT